MSSICQRIASYFKKTCIFLMKSFFYFSILNLILEKSNILTFKGYKQGVQEKLNFIPSKVTNLIQQPEFYDTLTGLLMILSCLSIFDIKMVRITFGATFTLFSYLLSGTYGTSLEVLHVLSIILIHNFYFTFPSCAEFIKTHLYNLGFVIYEKVTRQIKEEKETENRADYVYSTPVKDYKLVKSSIENNLGKSYIQNSTRLNSAVTSTSETFKSEEKSSNFSTTKIGPTVNLYNTQFITYETPNPKTAQEKNLSDYERILSRSNYQQKDEKTLDMRLNENRINNPGGITNTMFGEKDMRYSVNQTKYNTPLKQDGTPDMRFNENRINNPGGLTKTMFGDNDMRYSVNQHVPLKKDGTPDMRYSVNKQNYGNRSYY